MGINNIDRYKEKYSVMKKEGLELNTLRALSHEAQKEFPNLSIQELTRNIRGENNNEKKN